MESTKEGIRRTLAELMASSGKKNADLARACGVGSPAVSNWLSGKNSISIELMPTICDFFNITMDDFFGRSKEAAYSVSFVDIEKDELDKIWEDLPKKGRDQLLVFARGCAATYK